MIHIVPAVVGLAITAVGVRCLLKGRATAHWHPVAGTVSEVSISMTGGRPGNPKTVYFFPSCTIYMSSAVWYAAARAA